LKRREPRAIWQLTRLGAEEVLGRDQQIAQASHARRTCHPASGQLARASCR